MARRKNPVFDPIRREIEAAVGGSMIIVDKWFDAHQNAKADLEDALDLQAGIYNRIVQTRAMGMKVPEDDKEDLKAAIKEGNRSKQVIKQLDGKIAKYYKAALKDIGTRLDAFKASPGSSRYAGEYNDARRRFMLASKQAQFAGVDIRPKIVELQGAVAALDEALSVSWPWKPTETEETVRAAKRRLAPERKKRPSSEERWNKYVEIWEKIHPRAIATERYKTGGEKIRFAASVKGRKLRVTPTLDVKFHETVDDADVLMRVIARKKERGEDVSKNLPRLKKMIDDIEVIMRERPRRLTAPQVTRMLAGLRKDMLPYVPTERKKKAGITVQRAKRVEVAAFQKRLDDIQYSIQGQTADWAERDRRAVRDNIKQLESALTVISPTKGAPAKFRIPAKAISKRGNPKRKTKKATKKKASKRKVANKKTAKKKVARKATPEWQRLIRRCQKLWDHYCERPGKTRLQPVLKHLEKMEASTSKKVLDERKKCLRAARAEAKRLKMK